MKKAVLTGLVLSSCSVGAHVASWPEAAAAQSTAVHRHATDLDAARAGLAAADRAFEQATESRGLVEGFPSFFADSAAFLPSRSPLIRGRAAMQEYLRTAPLFGALRWRNVRTDVSADGLAGYTIGFGTLTGRDGGVLHARLITFWRREPGGAWKVEANVPALAADTARALPDGFGTPRGNGSSAAPPLAMATAAAAAMQADRDFAALAKERGPREAFTAFAAPTAMVVGGPSYGPREIGEGFDDPRFVLDWGPIAGGAAASGDLAWTVGYATSRAPQSDGSTSTGYSKYLTIWRRQPDGRWLYVADGGTSRPAG